MIGFLQSFYEQSSKQRNKNNKIKTASLGNLKLSLQTQAEL